MITVGVDLASQDARTALCVIEWTSAGGSVTKLTTGTTDGTILEWAADADKLGIDIPLGWPVAFAEAVAQHSRGETWPQGYLHSDTRAYRYRRTDLWVQQTLGAWPLSVSADRIGVPAMRAAGLLARVRGGIVRRDGSGVVVEVYPAAALKRWGLRSRGYKGPENAGIRNELVESLEANCKPWLTIDAAHGDLCVLNDNALDALIAALVARAAAVGQTEPIPPEEQDAASREGWIAVPCEDSLSKLGSL